MKFINEVVNGGVTVILFVVTNLVCVPKRKGICSFFGVSKGRGNILNGNGEWKWGMEMGKGDVTPVPSEMVRSMAQEEGVDPYHLDLVLLPLFLDFKNTESGSSPTRIE